MAPNFGIATRYDRDGQLATFLMSNIIPQTPTVNRNVWKEIEMLNAKQYGRCLGEVLVITGPIFGKNPAQLKGGVCIPEAYYKIVLDHADGELRTLAFLLRADSPATQRLNTTLVSIDDIEALTGIDVLRTLPFQDEKQMEALPATHLWFILPDQLQYYMHPAPKRAAN
jgi:endonuclease G